MTKNRDHSGFTLIEMLVAMAMIVIIVSIVYGSYAATSQSREIYQSRMTCSQRAHLVLRLMSRQIRCAYARPVDPNTTESTSSKDRILIEEVPDVFRGDPRNPRGEILGFATTIGLGGALNAQRGLSYVRYLYDSTMGTLSIAYGPHDNRRKTNARPASWTPILEGVTKIEMEFHDGRRWQSEWTDRRTKTLPRVVRIGITVVDENNREHQFGTAISIVCRSAIVRDKSEQKIESAQR